MPGSDGWDRFSLLNNAERLRGTATNFSVRRCSIINKYTNISVHEYNKGGETYHTGGKSMTSSGTTNTEGCVCVEVSEGGILEDEGSSDIQEGKTVKGRGSDDFRGGAFRGLNATITYYHSVSWA